MCITALNVLLNSSLAVLEPTQIKPSSPSAAICHVVVPESSEFLASRRLSLANLPPYIWQSDLPTLKLDRTKVDRIQPHFEDEDSFKTSNRQAEFKAGATTWKTNTLFGSLGVRGNFNPQARFTRGKALWTADNLLGSFDLAIDLSDRLQPTEAVTSWQKQTVLGSLNVRGKFDSQAHFKQGNVAWQAKTSYASIAFKGNLEPQTGFSGGTLKVATSALIGSFDAKIELDEAIEFKGFDASWNAKLPLKSMFKVSGKFDEGRTFEGGSIGLSTSSLFGTLGVNVNLDGDNQFTSGRAFWQTKLKLGSVGLNTDYKRNGEFESKVNFELPF